MPRKFLISLALVPLLAACGGGTVSSVPAPPPPKPGKVPVRTPVRVTPPAPKLQVAPGLEGVIGARPDDLVRQFGPARLDVIEGDARKLQFAGGPCVLDVFLYPPAPGKPPQATYVEARRASDAREVDRAACIAGLRKK
mgnify:CR=1 FL=1